VVFEKFLGTKYIGQKRFSLEGGESTIPALDAIAIHTAAVGNVEEIVIGMAHRGRLNILANIMGKTYEEIFNEFQGTALYDLRLWAMAMSNITSATHTSTRQIRRSQFTSS
jgi:2-oxoglutarate dehydrogenase E1 component